MEWNVDVIVVLVGNYSKESRAVEFLVQLMARFNPVDRRLRVGLVPPRDPSRPYLEVFTDDALRAAVDASDVTIDTVDGVQQMREHFAINSREGADKMALIITDDADNGKKFKKNLKKRVQKARHDGIHIFTIGENGVLAKYVQYHMLKDDQVDNIASLICTGMFWGPSLLNSSANTGIYTMITGDPKGIIVMNRGKLMIWSHLVYPALNI